MNGAFCNFREDWASEFLCDQGRKVVFRVVPRYSYRTAVLQYWVLSDVLVPVRYGTGTRIAILVRTLYCISLHQWLLEYTKLVILSVLFWASSLLALGGLSHLGCIVIIAKAPQANFLKICNELY